MRNAQFCTLYSLPTTSTSRSLPPYLAWIRYLSLWYYGFEAFSINQWDGVSGIECSGDSSGGDCLEDGQDVLGYFSFDAAHFGFDLAMLAALAVVFRLLALAALWARARK